MEKSAYIPHGLDMDVLNAATRGSVVTIRAKAEGKRAMKKPPLSCSWESAFHADRGCLDGGLPLRFAGPTPHH